MTSATLPLPMPSASNAPGPTVPQTDGKAEAFNKILQAKWAYIRPYSTNLERLDALPAFLRYYNHQRPHAGIGGATPASRL